MNESSLPLQSNNHSISSRIYYTRDRHLPRRVPVSQLQLVKSEIRRRKSDTTATIKMGFSLHAYKLCFVSYLLLFRACRIPSIISDQRTWNEHNVMLHNFWLYADFFVDHLSWGCICPGHVVKSIRVCLWTFFRETQQNCDLCTPKQHYADACT